MKHEEHPDVAVLVQVVKGGRRNPVLDVEARLGHRRQPGLSRHSLTMNVTGVRCRNGLETEGVPFQLLPAILYCRTQLLRSHDKRSHQIPALREFGPLSPSTSAFQPLRVVVAPPSSPHYPLRKALHPSPIASLSRDRRRSAIARM